jgi:hypothetical protein
MGSGRSRLPPPDPIGDLHREIRGLNDRVNDLNNHINNLNNIDRVKQRAINNLRDNLRISNNSDILHTGERDNYNRLYTADETVTIPALVTERDTLIAIRDDLYTKLGKSESSNKMTNDAAQTLADNTTQLSSQTVALDLQNYDTKLKLYEGIRVQNRTLMEKNDEIQGKFNADDQKVFYQSQLVEFLNKLNNGFSIIYLFLYVILILLLFLIKNPGDFYYYKLPLVIGFFIYPFIAIYLIDFVIYFFDFAYSVINANAYTNNY